MAIESIAKTLGAGSGMDIPTLVQSLVDAQYQAKQDALTKKDEALTAQISTASALKSSISTFDSSLRALITGGTLSTQATSANPSIVKASALPGASVAGFSGEIEVRALAVAQAANSAPIPDPNAALGGGTLTLSFGKAIVADGAMTEFVADSSAPIEIAIKPGASLSEIAEAINAKQAGITATILTDSSGARLVVKGATGAEKAFTLSASGDAALSALNIGVGAGGMTIGSVAQDAEVVVDGVSVKRATNVIGDLFVGVKLELQSAAIGTKVSLGTEAPTKALGQAVNDFVSAFNELATALKEATDPVNGPLKSDSAARAMLRALKGMTASQLISNQPAGAPTTLAGIGISTQRDGTLSVDTMTLSNALVAHGGAIEAMFKTGTGLSAALSSISLAAANRQHGLGASETRYTEARRTLEVSKERALAAAENMRTRMTRQFASMDSRVSAYQSTQSFLTNQIAAWNKDS